MRLVRLDISPTSPVNTWIKADTGYALGVAVVKPGQYFNIGLSPTPTTLENPYWALIRFDNEQKIYPIHNATHFFNRKFEKIYYYHRRPGIDIDDPLYLFIMDREEDIRLLDTDISIENKFTKLLRDHKITITNTKKVFHLYIEDFEIQEGANTYYLEYFYIHIDFVNVYFNTPMPGGITMDLWTGTEGEIIQYPAIPGGIFISNDEVTGRLTNIIFNNPAGALPGCKFLGQFREVL